MKKVLIKIIEWYQRHISVWFQSKHIMCKFYPTCSKYSIEAIEKYGAVKGGILALRRIIRCNPFSKGGYDPVP